MIGIGPNLAYRPTANVWTSGADLEFNFAETASVHPVAGRARLLCTRAGATATRINSAGVPELVAADTPRIDHDPATLRFENMIKSSEMLDDGAWTKNGATISSNAAMDSKGLITLDKIVESALTSAHGVYQLASKSAAAAIVHVLQFETKAGDRTSLQVLMEGSVSGNASVTFDLSAGTYGATSVAGSFAGASASITARPNGVWFCTLTATTNTDAGVYVTFNMKSGGSNSYLGDGASGLYVGRIQLNSGAAALEYQRTGATTCPKWYASKGLLMDEDPRTNLFLNSLLDGTNLNTQSIATTAQAYTISFYGTGSITLSGSATATISGTSATTRTSYTFTPTAGILACTVAGTVKWANAEAGAFPTSFIPTGAVAVTRNAETIYADISSIVNGSATGTILVVFSAISAQTGQTAVQLDDGTDNNSIAVRTSPSGATTDRVQVNVGGISQAALGAAGYVATDRNKIAVRWGLNDFSRSRNGGAVSTDTSGTVPTVTYVRLGSGASGNALNGHIERFAYWRSANSDTYLQQLSA